MRANIVIFWVLTAYFSVVTVLYTIWNLITFTREVEWSGTLALLACAVLNAFIAFYLRLHYRKQGGELHEDRLEADIDDADPELGEFSPWSWWPLVLAGGIAVIALGMAIGFNYWLALFAAPLVPIGVVGLVFEYYRGNFAR